MTSEPYKKISKSLSYVLRHRPAMGFRISSTDVMILASSAAACGALWPTLGSNTLIFLVVAGHFFLFCNVFRINRTAELIWAALFVVNVLIWTRDGPIRWIPVLAIQAPITLAAIVWAFLRSDYHGVLWKLAPHPRVLRSAATGPTQET